MILEVAVLAALGLWGWRSAEGWVGIVLALAIPLIAAALWGTFAVPDDPSRSGSAPVAVSGMVRLGLEAGLSAAALWALRDPGFSRLSVIFATAVIGHYLLSYDRVRWLIRQERVVIREYPRFASSWWR